MPFHPLNDLTEDPDRIYTEGIEVQNIEAKIL